MNITVCTVHDAVLFRITLAMYKVDHIASYPIAMTN